VRVRIFAALALALSSCAGSVCESALYTREAAHSIVKDSASSRAADLGCALTLPSLFEDGVPTERIDIGCCIASIESAQTCDDLLANTEGCEQ
jgi:hypothetical protein